jgi:hypothetical protein
MLSEDDWQMFETQGYMVVREAFDVETAAKCADLVWQEMRAQCGIERDDASTWPPIKCKLGVTFRESDGEPWSGLFKQKLLPALREICGEEGVDEGALGCGWWMCTFPREPRLGEEWGSEGAWHVDGHDYDHYAFSPEVGLVAIMLFSDIDEGGGGTALAGGSHTDALKVLLAHGLDGCRNTALARETLASKNYSYSYSEVTGKAGDVVLMHPCLLHARSANLALPGGWGRVRLMAHPKIRLRRPMDLVNPTTLLERVTRAAALAGCGSDDERAGLLRALEAVTPEAVAAHRAQRPAPNTEDEQGDSELYESLEGLPKQFKRSRKH